MDLVTSTIFVPGPGVHPDQTLVVEKLGLLAVGDAWTDPPEAEGEEGRGGVRIALEAIRASVERHADILERFRRNPGEELRTRILGILEEGFARAAQEVFAFGRRFQDLRVTLDVVLLLDHDCFVGHVGDGRVYLVRRGLVHQLTVDHTGDPAVFMDIDDPGPEAVGGPPRALGPEPAIHVESLCMELGDHDRFVLCPGETWRAIPEGVLHHHLVAEDLDRLQGAWKRSAPGAPLVGAAAQLGGSGGEPVDAGRSRLAILAPMPLLAHCTERELRTVASATHPRRLAGGATLFRQGDPGTELYLVIQGSIRIERDGKQIATLGAGSTLGEMALLDEPFRSATAVAGEDGEVMVISRDAFFALLRGNAPLAVKILWNMLLRLSANLRATSGDLARARGGTPLPPPVLPTDEADEEELGEDPDEEDPLEADDYG